MTETKTTPTPFGGKTGHPNYKTNQARVDKIMPGKKGYGAGQTECCSYCGKLALTTKFLSYHNFGDGFDEAPADPDTTVEEAHLGFYPLGSDCSRKLKKLVPVYDADGERI